MKAMQIILLAMFGTYMVSAYTTVPVSSPLRQVFGVGNNGFCYEVTKASGGSGSGTAYFLKGNNASPSNYDTSSVLATATTVYYYQSPNWGPGFNVSVDLVASGSSINVNIFTQNYHPCEPNPCADYRYLCVPKASCDNDCVLAPTYDCSASRNPCTAANIYAGNFYFAHTNGHKFIQCGGVGACYVQTCTSPLYWSQQVRTCVWG